MKNCHAINARRPAIAGAIGGGSASAVTAGTLAGITASLSGSVANLGGYATAQIVAASVGIGGGPALSVGIAAVGGPLVAGAIVTAGVGVAAAGLTVGGYALYRWARKPETQDSHPHRS
jgi:hypothetical protein